MSHSHDTFPPCPDDLVAGAATTGLKLRLLPPAPDCCQVCAHKHSPEEPHNAQSFYWATARSMERRPAPTWNEALEHCTPEMRAAWSEQLALRGVDLDKPGGNP